MTITEIAREAHVSIATVDRVLHNRGRVSEETKQKIEHIMQAGGYQPNLFARTLRTGAIKFGILMVDPKTRKVPGYWEMVRQGCLDAVQDFANLPIKLEIKYFVSQISGDLLKKGREFIAEGVKGLLFSPLSREDTISLMNELKDIPYGFYDADFPDAKPVTDTTQNPYLAGKTAGRMMQLLASTTQGICVMFNKTSAHNIAGRLAGFVDSFPEIEKPVELVIDESKELKPQIKSFLTEHPNLNGIFVLHSASTILVEVLNELHVVNRPRIIGFDDIPANRNLLERGEIDCIISQDPYGQGYRAVRQMALYLSLGTTVAESLHTPVTILLKENIATYRNTRLRSNLSS